MPLVNTICPRCATPVAYDVGSQLECRICGFKEGGLIQGLPYIPAGKAAPKNDELRLQALVIALLRGKTIRRVPTKLEGTFASMSYEEYNNAVMHEVVRCARKLIEEIDK
jgi:hypothetical protein